MSRHRFRTLSRSAASFLVAALSLVSAPGIPAARSAVLPTVSIGDVTVTEGTGGTVSAVFQVTQSTRGKSTVFFATSGGTAKAPGDFIARTGKIRFAGKKLTKTVAVTVVGDTIDEDDETFFVDLTNVSGATLSDARGEATISDDDAPPTISVAPAVTVPEGNAGDEAFASLDVTVSPISERAVSVGYSTSDGTATTADGDYEAASGTIDFAPGEVVQTILVKVLGDDAAEVDETFDVDISGPVHATLGNATGLVTVIDNDPIPPLSAVLSVSGASVREGKAGTTTVLTFTVSRSGELTTAVNVDVATSNGTATAAEDYVAATTNVAFGVGETTKTVDVTVYGDRRLEHAETLFLTLLNPSAGGAISTGQATGTITNDDSWTTLTVAKRSGRIVTTGRLSPARPGQRVTARLFRKRAGAWVPVKTKRPLLRGSADLNGDGFVDSTYRTRFIRPRPGACKVVARFLGTADLAPSKAVRRFRC